MIPVHHVVTLVSTLAKCMSPCLSDAQQVVKATLLSNAIQPENGHVKVSARFDVHNDKRLEAVNERATGAG